MYNEEARFLMQDGMLEEQENQERRAGAEEKQMTPYKSQRKGAINRVKSFSKSKERARRFKGMPTVKGREPEFNRIKKQIDSFLKYKNNSILYLTGVPGSGKTHTTLTLLNYLEVPYSYINCSTLKTRKDIYKEICDAIECACEIRNGTLQSLRYHLTSCCHSHIIVVDEVDFLITKNESFLYNLFEMPFMDSCKMFLVVISNTLGSLSSKLESRIAKNRIEFKPYNANQLMEVVVSEIQNGSTKVDQKSLELITKRIASSTGDIRKVREIIEESENLNLNRTSHILKDMATPLLNKFVVSLNFYQKLVLFLNTQPLKSMAEWFNEFKSFCKIKGYPVLSFADFQFVVNDLMSFDIYRMRKDGIYIACNYLQEEMEMAMKNDPCFDEFKSKKIGLSD
ncbi:uncharacterized protein VICG_01297 [Vittaforma corneae ATCC 50505]|uniref:AAA+ ATPase domain-containing protein n=1 Tax=Vittaforma corneae (strain ATCC 50505) TaxID=993615 RepID=L2GM17_VITCO|nr:uncharacterized protein VICG_01297 [Vittaforma corneae ATCC 50505]ELA41664.1 hypothetical protein VICG_01297 [Vittaforma corneae ATCC 50505]